MKSTMTPETYEQANKKYLELIDTNYRLWKWIKTQLFETRRDNKAGYKQQLREARQQLSKLQNDIAGNRAFNRSEITEEQFNGYMRKRKSLLDEKL